MAIAIASTAIQVLAKELEFTTVACYIASYSVIIYKSACIQYLGREVCVCMHDAVMQACLFNHTGYPLGYLRSYVL